MDKSRLASLGAAVALGAAGIAGGFLLAKTLDKQSRGRANSCCHGKAACSHVGNAIHVDSHMAGAHLHSSVPTSPTAELLDEQPTPSHVGTTAGAGAAPGEADSLVPVGRAVVAAKGKRRMSKGSMSAGGISPVIVGVAGASGSGKTSIAELIAARLHGGCVLSISSDNYYKTLPPGTDPSNYNFDHPSSIDFDLLASHLEKLKAGEDVDVPHYDFATHRRTGETTHVDAKKTSVIILDGIFVLWAEKVAAACDLTIFCSEDLDVCLVRRLRRDIVERKRTVESVLLQYLKFVKAGYEEFVAPSMTKADLIIPRAKENRVAIDMLARDLQRRVDMALANSPSMAALAARSTGGKSGSSSAAPASPEANASNGAPAVGTPLSLSNSASLPTFPVAVEM